MQLAEALLDVPALAAVGALRAAARGRRPRQAEAGVLLRRGAPALQRCAARRCSKKSSRWCGSSAPRAWACTSSPRTRSTSPTRCSASSATACSTRCAPSRRATRRRSRPPRETFRANPELDVEKAITELGVGEALVSLPRREGPAGHPVERACVLPPALAARPDHAGGAAPQSIATSLVAGRYEKAVDRESAYEKLKGEPLAARHPRRRGQGRDGSGANRRRHHGFARDVFFGKTGPRGGRSPACSTPPPRAQRAPSARRSGARSCAASSADCFGGGTRRR